MQTDTLKIMRSICDPAAKKSMQAENKWQWNVGGNYTCKRRRPVS